MDILVKYRDLTGSLSSLRSSRCVWIFHLQWSPAPIIERCQLAERKFSTNLMGYGFLGDVICLIVMKSFSSSFPSIKTILKEQVGTGKPKLTPAHTSKRIAKERRSASLRSIFIGSSLMIFKCSWGCKKVISSTWQPELIHPFYDFLLLPVWPKPQMLIFRFLPKLGCLRSCFRCVSAPYQLCINISRQ